MFVLRIYLYTNQYIGTTYICLYALPIQIEYKYSVILLCNTCVPNVIHIVDSNCSKQRSVIVAVGFSTIPYEKLGRDLRCNDVEDYHHAIYLLVCATRVFLALSPFFPPSTSPYKKYDSTRILIDSGAAGWEHEPLSWSR